MNAIRVLSLLLFFGLVLRADSSVTDGMWVRTHCLEQDKEYTIFIAEKNLDLVDTLHKVYAKDSRWRSAASPDWLNERYKPDTCPEDKIFIFECNERLFYFIIAVAELYSSERMINNGYWRDCVYRFPRPSAFTWLDVYKEALQKRVTDKNLLTQIGEQILQTSGRSQGFLEYLVADPVLNSKIDVDGNNFGLVDIHSLIETKRYFNGIKGDAFHKSVQEAIKPLHITSLLVGKFRLSLAQSLMLHMLDWFAQDETRWYRETNWTRTKETAKSLQTPTLWAYLSLYPQEIRDTIFSVCYSKNTLPMQEQNAKDVLDKLKKQIKVAEFHPFIQGGSYPGYMIINGRKEYLYY